MYIDTHTHLTDERYQGKAEDIIASLKENGIEYIINIGYDAKSSEEGNELSKKFGNVYCAAAIHPQDSALFTEADLLDFEGYAKNKRFVAIGETGLDYHYETSPRETQKKVFIRHMELARSLKLPVIIHLRDAYGDMLSIIRDNKSLLAYGGVLHCYSGSADMAKIFLDLGLYISFAGAVTFKNARGLIESVKAVPLDRILTETDCPYLTPEPHRGTLNYPYYVKYTAQKIAEIKNITAEELNGFVKKNAKTLFTRIENG